MFVKNVVFVALSATAALATPGSLIDRQDRAFGCGTAEPSAEHIGMSMVLAAQEERAGNLTERAVADINVYFHIVSSGSTIADGNISDTMINAQLNVLNADFAPHGFSFRLAGTDRTVNANWARDSDEIGMKRALRKGVYRDLNLYVQPRLANNALGYALLPVRATAGSTAFIRDGVSINAQTVPGGSMARFNLGKTGTHEVGHWLGLYHTFQGGCTGNGDFVADTPAQASASSGCPRGRNSCPTQPGLDPIHNYMDYSDDSCYEEFTPGQQARMESFWSTYRA